jgi:hypothetical protein
MKVKVDYVTNSSSEVFGVVAGSSVIMAGLIAVLNTLFAGCKVQSDNTQITKTQLNDITMDAQATANQLANAVIEDAKRQEQIVKDAYAEAKNTLDSAENALQKELSELNKAWEESEKTADTSDPGYADLKKQYDDYRDYLNSQIEQAKYQKQMVEYEEAVKQSEMESKNEWIRQRQADFIAAKEEKAMLEAVAKGYNKPGYDTEAVKIRLEQLNVRENELKRILDENNASIDYKAADRGSIGPSKESMELTEKIRKEKEAFEKAAAKADKEKRDQLRAEMEKNISEYEAQIAKANKYDMATKAAEGIQYGADIAVEGLSYVTGPAGQQIKLAYTAGKAVASGMGEGMADPKNAAKHLAKGILNAGTEVLKDKFGSDKPWQAAATGILNEGLQSGLDAAIKGESVTEALGKGLTKGVADAGVDKVLDKIKDKLPIPKGSSVEVGDYSVNKILNNNPLTKGIARTVIREGGGSKLKDAIKGEIVDKTGKAGGFVDPE